MKVLMFAAVLALTSVSVFAAEAAKKKVSHDVEHHHVDGAADHDHEEAHHKDHDHKAHHPAHDADAAKHEESHKAKKVTK